MAQTPRNDGGLSPLKRAYLALETMQARVETLEQAQREPIAILGMGCRYPRGVKCPEDFWDLLQSGRDAIEEVPPERWDVDALYDPDPNAPGKVSSRYGGFIDNIDQFDALFFGISPREAEHLDPQQCLLLEVTQEAFEYAGVATDRIVNSQTGVFVGLANDFDHLITPDLEGSYDAAEFIDPTAVWSRNRRHLDRLVSTRTDDVCDLRRILHCRSRLFTLTQKIRRSGETLSGQYSEFQCVSRFRGHTLSALENAIRQRPSSQPSRGALRERE